MRTNVADTLTREQVEDWRSMWVQRFDTESVPTLRDMLAQKIALCDLALAQIESSAAQAQVNAADGSDDPSQGRCKPASAEPDLVARLRDKAHCNDWYLRQEAADALERLARERDTETENVNAQHRRHLRVYAELSARIAELERDAARWIPVSERLPEGYRTVLATDGLDTVTAFLQAGQKWCRHDSIDADWTPTHWMPLPKSPDAAMSDSAREGKG